MPKRQDIESVLVIGAGPIIIGQACEFDYSGVQAIKALKSEGCRVILVNSNPATIMTDPELADATYIEPITPEYVEKIIVAEKPDALLPTMGGQTALNCALKLQKTGVLEVNNVELIGANAEAIEKAEDRQLFREAMDRIGLESPKSKIITAPEQKDGTHDWRAGLKLAMDTLDTIGLPAIIRPAFTLGGTGGGVAYNIEEFETICRSGLIASPAGQILIDESLLGWKEYEMEVVRDRKDNAIIVCSIENIDPMGVHTGDSITVAPALTLTDREFQIMRNASLAVLREIGVETGGSNVQFAVNPENGRLVVIEMNPRVSRSSALASKATGFPIAKVAAKLALGYTLDELDNDITEVTPASFEPTIDYVVTKIPRFAFEKYRGSNPLLSTSMKSVGETMAIGRNFQESIQKALCSLEIGLNGFDELNVNSDAELRSLISKTTPERLRAIAQAFRRGFSVEEVKEVTFFDLFFLRQIKELVEIEQEIQSSGLPHNKEDFVTLKSKGFSDVRLACLTGKTEFEVRSERHRLGVRPVYKRVDTCAAEFEAKTPYLYSTYEHPHLGAEKAECESEPSKRKKAMIIGGGPNRIGQGIEFDYCCCHAAFALKDLNLESIMVNCNPETVSTDYDTSDRLYFEPLTNEHVIEIAKKEQEAGDFAGVIVQFGGQTPLGLVKGLRENNIPILGTSPNSIDLAENREQFQSLLTEIGLQQAPGQVARSTNEALEAAEKIGFPVMLRPSFVLGGRAMEVIRDAEDLKRYVKEAVEVSGTEPLLIDRYLSDAIEVDVDAICDGDEVYIAGVMEHIEEAGVHSGDSACALPPYTLDHSIVTKLQEQAEALALALEVKGLINIQFAVQGNEIFILEANPRASRTVPFVAKVTATPVAGIAAKIMAGSSLNEFGLGKSVPRRVAVKEAVFPFSRFPGVDPTLGPEMRSTGEVMGWDDNFGAAFLKSQISAGITIPTSGKAFISVKDSDKDNAVVAAKKLFQSGFDITATVGTANYLRDHGVDVVTIKKVMEGQPHIVDAIKNGDIQIIFNTTEGAQSLADSASIRETALAHSVPCFTTMSACLAVMQALHCLRQGSLGVQPLQ